jgi:hypothetical protein
MLPHVKAVVGRKEDIGEELAKLANSKRSK